MTDAECTNGFCDTKTGACTPHANCDTVVCETGEVCDDATLSCVPDDGPGGALGDCAVCATDADCGGAPYACIPFGGGSYCLSSCASHNDCVSGFKCFTPPGSDGQLCIPGGYSCEKPCLQSGCPAGWERAAKKGNAMAMDILAYCYKNGKDEAIGTGDQIEKLPSKWRSLKRS